MPNVGLVNLLDPETGELKEIDTVVRGRSPALSKLATERIEQSAALPSPRPRIDFIHVDAGARWSIRWQDSFACVNGGMR